MPDLCVHIHVSWAMEALRCIGPVTRLQGSILVQILLWFSCYSFQASYYTVLVLVRITSLQAVIISPGFLRAGHSTVNSVNFATLAHRVTPGHGCSAVPVSCLGETAGITFVSLIIAI
jgi:hypothetical protein